MRLLSRTHSFVALSGLVGALSVAAAPGLASAQESEPKGATRANPGASSGSTDASTKLAKAIDAYIDARIAHEKLDTAPPADDAEFLRRLSLDVLGEVPKPKEVVGFLGDSDLDKRAKKIDELLARPGNARSWAEFWTDVLDRESTTKQREEQFKTGVRDWLTDRFAENMPFDEITRRLIAAEGLVKDNGAVGYVISYTGDKLAPDPMALAGTTARVFLGLQIECAQCHDHPFASWKRDDFMGFAAFFARARLDRERIGTRPDRQTLMAMTPEEREKAITAYRKMQVLAPVGIKEASEGELHAEVQTVRNPGDKKVPAAPMGASAAKTNDDKPATYVAAPKFFGTGAISTVSAEGNRRELLGKLMTSDRTPYFAQSCANRIWGRLTGRPLVAPTEDLSDPAAPHDPELLGILAKGLKDLRYDHKAFVRAICLTNAYARSSKLPKGDDKLEPTALRRAEQEYALGVVRPIDARPLGRAFVSASLLGEGGLEEMGPLQKEGALRRFETVFGGANLDPKKYEETIPEALFLMNGPSPGTPGGKGGGANLAAKKGAGANAGAGAGAGAGKLGEMYKKLAEGGGQRGPGLEARRDRAVERLLEREDDERERVTTLYLAALSRPATAKEIADATAYVSSVPEKNIAYEDLLWVLLNSAEFRFNR